MNDGLSKNGNISRGISFGNTQDVVVSSNLNLQVSGKLTPEIDLVLAATDAFCSAHPSATKAVAAAVDRARLYCANPKNEAEIIRIYRKQMLNKLYSSVRSFGAPGQSHALATLISFEPGTSNGHAKDPFISLASACAALPGITLPERDIRDVVKRVFSTVH